MKLRRFERAGTWSPAPTLASPLFRPPSACIGPRRLRGFLTACYYDPDSRLASLARRLACGRFAQPRASLASPLCPGDSSRHCTTVPTFDMLLRLEARYSEKRPAPRPLARAVANHLVRYSPGSHRSMTNATPRYCWSSATSVRWLHYPFAGG